MKTKDKIIAAPATVLTRRSVLSLLSAAALSLGLPQNARAKTSALKINWYDEFAPLSFVQADGKIKGILVDSLTEILVRRMGINVAHSAMAWGKAQEEVKQGKSDVLCTLITDARREYLNFGTEPLYKSDRVIVFSKNNPKVDQIRKIVTADDLKKFTVGTYAADSKVKTLFKDMKVDIAPDMAQVLVRISFGLVDIAFTDTAIWKYNARTAGIRNKLDSIPFVDSTVSTFYFGVRKNHPDSADIVQLFDKAVLTARSDGSLNKIIDFYG